MAGKRRPANRILDLALESLQSDDAILIKSNLAEIVRIAGTIRADTGLSDTAYQRKHKAKKDPQAL